MHHASRRPLGRCQFELLPFGLLTNSNHIALDNCQHALLLGSAILYQLDLLVLVLFLLPSFLLRDMILLL